MRRHIFVMAVVSTIGGYALAQNTTIPSLQVRSTPQPDRITLDAGDAIDIEVFDTPELSTAKVRVGDEGVVKLPVIGDTKVQGLTALEASKLIEDKLRDAKIMLDPHVTVLVTEYATQGVRVLGQVKNPGTYVLLGDHSIYDALAAAGGVNAQQGSSIIVTHKSDPAHPEIVYINSPDYTGEERLKQALPGDVIVVSRAGAVFVVGDVGHPGQYFIDNGQPLTVLQAVALAQGMNKTAKSSSARILRKTNDGATLIDVNIDRMEKNKETNIALQPADILIIPRSGVKAFFDYALPYAAGDFIGTSVGAAIVR